MDTGCKRSMGCQTRAGDWRTDARRARPGRDEPEPLVDAIARELRRMSGPGRGELGGKGSVRRSRSQARRLLNEAFARGAP